MKWHFTSAVFLPWAHNPNLIMRKHLTKFLLSSILQTTWSVLLKAVQVIKNKEKVKNTHNQEEPGETLCDQLECSSLDGILEDKKAKSKEIWVKYGL